MSSLERSGLAVTVTSSRLVCACTGRELNRQGLSRQTLSKQELREAHRDARILVERAIDSRPRAGLGYKTKAFMISIQPMNFDKGRVAKGFGTTLDRFQSVMRKEGRGPESVC